MSAYSLTIASTETEYYLFAVLKAISSSPEFKMTFYDNGEYNIITIGQKVNAHSCYDDVVRLFCCI